MRHGLGDFGKRDFVVVQAGRHTHEFGRAQRKRDEQQRDHGGPLPTSDRGCSARGWCDHRSSRFI